MKFVVFAVLLILLLWAVGTLEQRTLYYPDRTLTATPALLQIPHEEVLVKAKDGTELHGWWIAGPGKNSSTVLFCHGNGGNISHRLDKIKILRELGLNVLMFDYRGYGKSSGRPSEKGLYQDAEAFYGFLTQERRVAAEKIVLYGESLGCAVALETALHHPVAGVILESPFTSTVDMGKLVFPWLPVKWIVRQKYDNFEKISKIKAPLLFLHSPQDETVPFSMGKTLFAAAPEPKKFIELRGGHNEGYDVSGSGYRAALREFIRP